MTQDEIIKQEFGFKHSVVRFTLAEPTRNAMNIWAQKQATDFAEFLRNKTYYNIPKGEDSWKDTDEVCPNIDELYKIFTKQ